RPAAARAHRAAEGRLDARDARRRHGGAQRPRPDPSRADDHLLVAEPLGTAQIAELLESTCALIEAEMKALGDDGCRWHFKDGEWCVNECVGHLIEAEKRGFAGRIRDLIAGKPIQSWDQAQVARDRRDCDRVSQRLWMEFM